MRVRSEQPSHIFTGTETGTGPQTSVKSGDLCIFTRVDCEKCLLGRIIQFSYLAGSKKERQYSSDFVGLSKESYKSIGVYANWFQGTRALDNQVASTVSFKPVDLVFTPGYLAVGNYVASIDDSTLVQNADFSFSVPVEILKTALPRWRVKLTFDMTSCALPSKVQGENLTKSSKRTSCNTFKLPANKGRMNMQYMTLIQIRN